ERRTRAPQSSSSSARRVAIREKETAPGSGVPTDLSPWLRARPLLAAMFAVASADSVAPAAPVATTWARDSSEPEAWARAMASRKGTAASTMVLSPGFEESRSEEHTSELQSRFDFV